MKQIEEKGLKYVAAINKNKNFFYKMLGDSRREKHGIEEIAKSLAPEDFEPVVLPLEKPRTVWVAAIEVYLSTMSGKRLACIQMNTPIFEEAAEMDYYLTNEMPDLATGEWIAQSYSRRN